MCPENVPNISREIPSQKISSPRISFAGELQQASPAVKESAKIRAKDSIARVLKGLVHRFVEVPKDSPLAKGAEIARAYLQDEFRTAGVLPEDVADLSPLYAVHSSNDKVSGKTAGFSYAGQSVVFVNSRTMNNVAGLLVTAHEMSHAAATTISLYTSKGFMGREILWRREQAGLDGCGDTYNITRQQTEIAGKPSFLEDAMANWDAARIMERFQANGILPQDREVGAGTGLVLQIRNFLRKYDIYKTFPEEYVPFFLMQRNRLSNVATLFKEINELMIIRAVARAVGNKDAQALRRSVTAEEAIELGRQVLQRSRLAHTTEAQEKITAIFGERGAKIILGAPQDPLISLLRISRLLNTHMQDITGAQ